MAQSASRPAARAHPAKDRSTLYEEITNKIIAQLESGRLPWVQPWGSSGVRAPLRLPRNAATGRTYSGINVLILWASVVENGFAGQSWLTYRQAAGLGGHVRKGERGTTVDRFVPDDVRDRAQDRGEEPGVPVALCPAQPRQAQSGRRRQPGPAVGPGLEAQRRT